MSTIILMQWDVFHKSVQSYRNTGEKKDELTTKEITFCVDSEGGTELFQGDPGRVEKKGILSVGTA